MDRRGALEHAVQGTYVGCGMLEAEGGALPSGPLAGILTPARTPKTAVHDVNGVKHAVAPGYNSEEQFSRWGFTS